MSEEEDVKRIEEVLIECRNNQQEDDIENYEYEEFINFDGASEYDDADEDIYILPDVQTTDISKYNSHASSLSLKDDEKQVINSCQDLELKRLLLLNRNKNISLMRTFKKLKDMLIECQENIKTKRDYISSLKKKKIRSTKCWRLAAPYFKGKDLYPCPANPDVISKNKNNEIFFYDMVPTLKWTQTEIQKLLKAVKINYHINSQKRLLRQITEAKKDMNVENKEEKTELIKELKEKYDEQAKVKQYTQIPPLNSNEFIDWDDISEKFFSRRFSALECKTFWNIYGHPLINKSPWTSEENSQLENIVEKYDGENWEAISQELNSGRTPFLTCLHYFSNICPRSKKSVKFSEQEDELLMQLVNNHKQGNVIQWSKIVRHFKDRTRGQLFYRHRYLFANYRTKKGKFSESEDVLLMILVDRFGRNFSKCAEYFRHRSMTQLKSRYTSNLGQPIKKGSFTIQDDEYILNHVKEHGETKWDIVVNKINRCRAQITQRYRVLHVFLKNNPRKTLKDAPRRKHPLIAPEKDNYPFLRMIADKFCGQSIIPTLYDIKKALRQNRMVAIDPNPYGISDSSSEDEEQTNSCSSSFNNESQILTNVDDMLTDFFTNSFEMAVPDSTTHVDAAVRCIKSVLDILHVNLEIPENFEQNSYLDNLDVAVLSHLCCNVPNINNTFTVNSNPSTSNALIPPNVYTLVGLRSLLIKYVKRSDNAQDIFDRMDESRSHKQVLWCINKHFAGLELEDKISISAERELLFQRFLSLFKFPAIMTLQRPSRALISTSNFWKYKSPLDFKRTYSKKTSNITGDDHMVDKPELVQIVDTQSPKLNVLPVKILTGIMVKDIKTLKLGADGQVTELQALPVQKSEEAKAKNNEEVVLKPVSDKGIINHLKQQIQQQLNDLTKTKNKKIIFRGQQQSLTASQLPQQSDLQVNKNNTVASYKRKKSAAPVPTKETTIIGPVSEVQSGNQQFETVLVNGEKIKEEPQNWRKKIASSPSKGNPKQDQILPETSGIKSTAKQRSARQSSRRTSKKLQPTQSYDSSEESFEQEPKIIKPDNTIIKPTAKRKPTRQSTTKTSKKLPTTESCDSLEESLDEVSQITKPAKSRYARKRKNEAKCTDTDTNHQAGKELTTEIGKPSRKVSYTQRRKRRKVEEQIPTNTFSSARPESDNFTSSNNSVFNVGKGELLVTEMNTSEDVKDVMMLDEILKKEKADLSESDVSDYEA